MLTLFETKTVCALQPEGFSGRSAFQWLYKRGRSARVTA
jgi:hypothetical protein